MNLTKTAIDGLQPSTSDVWLWDSELPGFGVRCNQYGRKTFVLRYRTVAGKQRKQLIGLCSQLSIRDAREIARKVIAEVRGGDDPIHDRKRERAETTLSVLWHRFHDSYCKAYTKPQTVASYRQIWGKCLKALHGRRLTDITRADVLDLHASMHANPTAANRSVALLSKMYNVACDWELLPPGTNPARRIRKYPERIRERVLTTEEVGRLLTAAEASDTPEPIRLLTKLLLLTGCRLSEIREARSEWVDFEQGLLLLPDSKTGQRPVALSDAALQLLEGCKERAYIIRGRWPHKPAKRVHGAFNRLCERAGLEGVTPHVLRHTVGSLGHRAGLSQREIADLLGHKQLVTTQRYMHGFRSERRKNADKVASLMGM